MKYISSFKKLFIIYLLIICYSKAYGQTEQQPVPADLKQQTIVTEPVTLQKGFFRVGILLNYQVADKYFTSSGTKEYYIASTWGSKSSYDLTLQYGISDRFQVDFITEYMNTRMESQNTEIIAATGASLVSINKQKGLGLGDSYISLNYQVLPEAKYKVSLTGKLNITVPTGEKNPTNIKGANQFDLPVGDGTYAIGLNILAKTILYPYSFTGYFSYTNNFSGTKFINPGDLFERKFRFGNFLQGGLSANLLLNEWIVLANEINYYFEGDGKIDNEVSENMPASHLVSYEPELLFQVKRFRLGESVKIPIIGKNVPADPLYVVMIQYVF